MNTDTSPASTDESTQIAADFEQGRDLYVQRIPFTYCENSDQEAGYENARENRSPRAPSGGRHFPVTGQTARQSACLAGFGDWKNAVLFAKSDDHEWVQTRTNKTWVRIA